MRYNFYNKDLYKLVKQTQIRLKREEEIKMKNADAGYAKYSEAERRNRKLRNKYCMSGRRW